MTQANPRSNNREDLFAQIRNNNLKLRPVKITQKEMALDASAMNKEERKDFAENLRQKLRRRKLALNRRNDDD